MMTAKEFSKRVTAPLGLPDVAENDSVEGVWQQVVAALVTHLDLAEKRLGRREKAGDGWRLALEEAAREIELAANDPMLAGDVVAYGGVQAIKKFCAALAERWRQRAKEGRPC
jgi:hypothetical protein